MRPLLVIRISIVILLFQVSFSLQAQTYFLNGDAISLGGDCYQLTPSTNFANGTVWYGNQLDLTQPFDIQFRMNLGVNDGSGADGICFVMHTLGTSAIGENGGGMGYLGFNNSLGIEFDTYQNGQYGDPFEDHIAIQQNGDINHNGSNNISGPVQMSPFSVNTEDGEYHTVQIIWNPQNQTIRVFFDCAFRIQGSVDLIQDIFNGQNLVYWGFTSATGGNVNDQIVCLQENILSVGENVTICSGSSAVLAAGASLNGVYQWSPIAYLDDPTSATPIATPLESTTYTVVYTDLCGDQQTAAINVNVEDLAVSVSPVETLSCLNSNTAIIASSNFQNDILYLWTDNNGSLIEQGLNLGLLNVNQPGTYNLLVNYLDQCFASTQIDVLGNFTVTPSIPTADSILNCNVDSVMLYSEIIDNSTSYSWTFESSVVSVGSTLLTNEPGTYMLTTTNLDSGCSDSEEFVLVQDVQVPFLILPAQDTLNCLRRKIVVNNFEITNSDVNDIQWTALTGEIEEGEQTISPTLIQPGLYQVEVTSLQNGCSNSANVEIAANEYFFVNLDLLQFPNIITPNGDSKNDAWRPYLMNDPDLPIMDLFTSYHLKVFNRWGSEIDELKSSQVWRPEFSDGTYYYVLDYDITCEKNRRETVSGEITITSE